jgi:concanavalin A-like lectin/glucanase superfamily protein
MKKQILFIAVTISAVLFSCSKEKIETQQNQALESNATSKASSEKSSQLYINTLNIGLVGRFEFDANLKDQTGKLADGTPVGTRGAGAYTTDRNGNTASALNLTGYYGLNILDVPEPTKASLAVWAKSLNTGYHPIVMPSMAAGNFISQSTDTYIGGEFAPQGGLGGYLGGAGSADNQWHHLVVTYDGTNIRLYKDGVLDKAFQFAGSFAEYLAKYCIGYHPNQTGYWKGYLDDLRFYNRVLTSSEVQQLASL